MDAKPIAIERFQPQDQDRVKALILQGLGERWGWIDPSANPDLDSIAASYDDGIFLVALLDGELIGTGALRQEASRVARISRMSVANAWRGQGIGTAILDALAVEAKALGIEKLVLETTSTWTDAIRFYETFGFAITHQDGGNTHLALDLQDTRHRGGTC